MAESKVVDSGEIAEKPSSWLGVRHLQTLLLFLGMFLSFSMRVNMSMAIVAMTDATSQDSFSWSIQTQSVILSSFFWGYVMLQIPAGEVAARWGGKLPVCTVVAINSAVCLGLPMAASYGGWQAVCACRVIQGLSQGFLYPSMHNIIGKWVPLTEKSRLGTIIYSGGQCGTAIQLMISGFIAEAWGWSAIFYVNGACGTVWTVLFCILGSSSPKSSRVISEAERSYIETSLGQVGEQKKVPTPWKSILTSLPFWALLVAHCGQNWGFRTLMTEMPSYMSQVLGVNITAKVPTPWKSILTSLPFWALLVAHCGQNWGFWTLMTEMPSYMSQVLGVNITANGVMSALPYMAMFLMGFPFGFFSDYMLRKNWLSITACRKLFNTIGLWGPALALVGLSYAPAGKVNVAVALLTLTVGLNAGHYTGFLLVHIDMAPQFAGTLMGITNTVANFISIIAPLAAGLLLNDETDANEWRKVFYLSSAIYIVFNGFFLLFGTSERQAWNETKTDTNCTDSANVEKAV